MSRAYFFTAPKILSLTLGFFEQAIHYRVHDTVATITKKSKSMYCCAAEMFFEVLTKRRAGSMHTDLHILIR